MSIKLNSKLGSIMRIKTENLGGFVLWGLQMFPPTSKANFGYSPVKVLAASSCQWLLNLIRLRSCTYQFIAVPNEGSIKKRKEKQ